MADDTTCSSCGFRGGLHHSLCAVHLKYCDDLVIGMKAAGATPEAIEEALAGNAAQRAACPPCISMQRACSRCGGLQNVVLLHHGWACDFCLGGDRMPDYEALGYPETVDTEYISAGGLESLVDSLDLVIGSFVGDVCQRAQGIMEKDIPSSTDIVDSGSKDSYK